MKKIVLMMLVAMIPFLTMAQKRSKKGKNTKVETVSESNANYEFMVITGYEVVLEKEKTGGVAEIESPEMKVKKMMTSNSRIMISFDFGNARTKENVELMRSAESFRTMAAAANGAANKGWDFVSSNVILSEKTKIHYYYMKRNK